MRLKRTVETAIASGIANFTSTLLISHQQKHDILKETCDKLAKDTGVNFLYADLRKRYSDSRCITKPMDLYRQQYCGCIYSEWERYTGKTIGQSVDK
jgi:predicted adenine nucleotide alpha hydrolase (AANH) superfamily ATPase